MQEELPLASYEVVKEGCWKPDRKLSPDVEGVTHTHRAIEVAIRQVVLK